MPDFNVRSHNRQLLHLPGKIVRIVAWVEVAV